MRMFMTRGMFGRCLEQIGDEMATAQDCLKELASWKAMKVNRSSYKIEPYDRFVFGKDNSLAIDFGDHSIFMLVLGATDEQLNGFKTDG